MYTLGKASRKKVGALLDFVQIRGGRALPKFFVHFSQTVHWVNLGMGRRGGDTPAQFFWYIGIKKKWYKLSKLEGGGSRYFGQNPKKQLLFFVKRSLIMIIIIMIVNLSASDDMESRCFLVSASLRKQRIFSPSRYLWRQDQSRR